MYVLLIVHVILEKENSTMALDFVRAEDDASFILGRRSEPSRLGSCLGGRLQISMERKTNTEICADERHYSTSITLSQFKFKSMAYG